MGSRGDTCPMIKYRYSSFDEELFDAMQVYNTGKPSAEKFTLIDARIISLIHSYNFANQTFFASNQYLADKCLTTMATIQKSINRLCQHNLITKDVHCVNGIKKRILTYNEPGAQQFKHQNQLQP